VKLLGVAVVVALASTSAVRQAARLLAAGSARIGMVVTNRAGDRDRLLIAAGNPSRVTATFDPLDLPKLTTLVSRAIDKVPEVANSSDR
jgi:hypothetical protein